MSKIEFRLDEIQLMRSSVWDYKLKTDDPNLEKVSLKINIEFGAYLSNFMSMINFEFNYLDKDSITVNLAKFDVMFTFNVTNLDNILDDDYLKKQLILNVISVIYSTSRGIIFCETKGFELNKFILKPKNANEVYDTYFNNKEINRFVHPSA